MFDRQAGIGQSTEYQRRDQNRDGASKTANELFLLHRKRPNALPHYAEFKPTVWTRNDIGVMFWTGTVEHYEVDCPNRLMRIGMAHG